MDLGVCPTVFDYSWLDLVPYDKGLELQKRLKERRKAGEIEDQLLLLEHPPTVTVGASDGAEDQLKRDRADLRKEGIAVEDVRRGGHLTYHGPGQLVAYPIMKLPEKDLEDFLFRLEGAVLKTLREFGLRGTRNEDQAGIRVDGEKICSLGIKVSQWVNHHGLALNVDMDLRPFDHIVPCDEPGDTITTMERELSRAPMLSDVREVLVTSFEDVMEQEGREVEESTVWGRAYEEVPDEDKRKLLPKRGEENKVGPKPPWLKATIPGGESYKEIESIMDDKMLNTVCEEANCPNLGECWDRGTATFMILGDTCTRACGFCDVKTGKDLDVDRLEPGRVAKAVEDMELDHAVITSVNRDDLDDGGAQIWANTIEAVRHRNPETSIEVLIPDLMGDWEALQLIFDAEPDILNHNVETVPRLYPKVRPMARYERSLNLLQRSQNAGFPTKSGIMLGIGERQDEVRSTLRDLYDHGVRILTLGQYLRPDDKHLPVDRWVHPEEFQRWGRIANEMGFDHVESGPMVRSSYHADEQVPDSADLTTG
jgi:lipoic acid synthetase